MIGADEFDTSRKSMEGEFAPAKDDEDVTSEDDLGDAEEDEIDDKSYSAARRTPLTARRPTGGTEE